MTRRKPPLKNGKKRRGGQKPKKSGEAEIRRASRAAEIMNMRLQGWSLDQIGKSLTPALTSQRVGQIIDEELKRKVDTPIEELRELELRRLDELQTAVFARAIGERSDGGAGVPDLAALDRVVAIHDRRARLLGIVAPTKIEQTGKDGGPIEHHVIAAAAATFDSKLARVFAAHDAARVPPKPDGRGEGGEAL